MEHFRAQLETVKGRAPASLFVNGAWVKSQGGADLQVVAPHNEEVLLTYQEATPADIDAAVAAAREAFERGPWSKMTPSERGDILIRMGDELQKRMTLLGETWTGQMGCPIFLASKASAEVPELFHYYGQLAKEFAFEEPRRLHNGWDVRIVQQPVGVVAAVTPWNAPMVLLCYKVAAGLAAGCTIVAKPSPETPIDAYILAECAEAAGLPAGCLNILPAGRETGDYLIRHPQIDKVAFTGSTAAGKHIAKTCMDRLARVSLELGGKSAAIMLEDADVPSMLKSLVPYSMPITGQVCFSLTRVLVPESRKQEALDAYTGIVSKIQVGDPFEPTTQMGPLSMERQRERVEGYIKKGRDEGAKLVLGGGRPKHLNRGFFIEPTVFSDVDNSMTIAQEEIFGPVVSFIPYKSEDDAIRIANDSVYGLNGAVYSGDKEHGYSVAKRIRTGNITVNGLLKSIEAPFGGFKQSGMGREGGPEGLKSYLETQTVYFA